MLVNSVELNGKTPEKVSVLVTELYGNAKNGNDLYVSYEKALKEEEYNIMNNVLYLNPNLEGRFGKWADSVIISPKISWGESH